MTTRGRCNHNVLSTVLFLQETHQLLKCEILSPPFTQSVHVTSYLSEYLWIPEYFYRHSRIHRPSQMDLIWQWSPLQKRLAFQKVALAESFVQQSHLAFHLKHTSQSTVKWVLKIICKYFSSTTPTRLLTIKVMDNLTYFPLLLIWQLWGAVFWDSPSQR